MHAPRIAHIRVPRRVFLASLLGCLLLPLLWLAGCGSGLSVALRGPTATPATTPTSTGGAAHSYRMAFPPFDVPPVLATRVPTPTLTPVPTDTPATPPPLATPVPTATSTHSRQAIFEKVWRTIDENYLYDDFRGLDWDDVWAEFAPRVAVAESDESFYLLLTEMVGRLDDNHSRFLAPLDAVEESVITVGLEARVGIGVITAPTSDGVIIQHVFSDSPAARAELRPRDRIIAVDGEPFMAGRDITGREGSTVRLTVARPDDTTRDVVLTRQHVEGRISPLAQRLDDDIGYLRVTTLWVNDMADQVSGALTDLVVERPLNGLILDLRGNPGGWREVLTNVLGHFVQGNAGMFYDRHSVRPLTIRGSSGPDLRGLPLVVLIDRNTASYAEVLAAILQAEADAYVIGMPSSGNTETIYAYELSDGARLWVAQEGFRLRNGTNLEGHGVQPDQIIDAEWARYSQANDPHILAALRYLYRR